MQKIILKVSKKVLIITSTFPRGNDDVLASWIGELCLRLKKEGLTIEILAPSYKGQKQSQYHGITVHRFRYAPSFLEILAQDEGAVIKIRRKPWILPLVILYVLFGAFFLINLTKKTHYDIMHVHWPIPQGIFGLIAKWILRSRLILTFYGAEFTLVKKLPILKYFLRFIIGQADSITAISTFTAKKVKEIKNIPVAIIPFSSSIEARSHKVEKNMDRKKRILFVGRLVDRKGVEFLISAMPMILKETDAYLDIVGSGHLYTSLRDMVLEMKLNNFVTMRGSVTSRELAKLYEKCSVFVLPAITDEWGETEGLGVVLLEAMSFRKPVVASSVGGIGDIVEDGVNGFLVAQQNSRALASAIIKIIQDENLAEKMGENGFRLLIAKFSWKSIIEKYMRAYSNL